MSNLSLLRRGALVAASFTALAPAAVAHADAVAQVVSNGAFIDATSDGRYVLYADHVLDRTTGTSYPVTGGTPLAIADRSPRVLLQGAGDVTGPGATWSVVDVLSGQSWTPGSTISDLLTGRADLVRDGHTVIFQSQDDHNIQGIYQYDLDAGTRTLRLGDQARLLDASEDANVVTFKAQTPTAPIPADFPWHLPNSDGSTLHGTKVGYVVGSNAARIVDMTKAQTICLDGVQTVNATRPTDLQISQNGSNPHTAKYLLTEERDVLVDAITQQERRTWMRPTPDGEVTAFAPFSPNDHNFLTVDPVSGAYVTGTEQGGSFPKGPNQTNVATLHDSDGTLTILPAPAQVDAAPFITGTYTLGALPFFGGDAVLYNASVIHQDGGRPTTTLVANGTAGGKDLTNWEDLPRPGDRLDDAAIAPQVYSAPCSPGPVPTDPVPSPSPTTTPGPTPTMSPSPAPALDGSLGDYATVLLRSSGNSAGVLRFTPQPEGLVSAKSVTATISWFGFSVWHRTLSGEGTLALPAILPGFPGFTATVKVTLADGTVLSQSAALRRAR